MTPEEFDRRRDLKRRQEWAKQGRLYLLSLVCATVGAVTIARTDRLSTGIFAFGLCLLILGPILYLYEKRRR